MSLKLLVVVLSVLCFACSQQIKEAKEANKKSDSILNEFNKVNAGLDSVNKGIDSTNKEISDSLDSMMKSKK